MSRRSSVGLVALMLLGTAALLSGCGSSTVSPGYPAGALLAPDVVGLRLAKAASVLKAGKFKMKVSERYAGAPRGTVFAQSPPGGDLAPHGRVSVLVSKGGAHLSDLIGLPETQANTDVRRGGFLLRDMTEPPISAANAIVVNQIPGGGWTRAHRMVTLQVSSGPKAVLVRVDRLWSSLAPKVGLVASPSSCQPFSQPGVYTCTGKNGAVRSSTEVTLTAGTLSLWQPPKTHKPGGHGHHAHKGPGKGHGHGGHHHKTSGSTPTKP